MLATTAIFISFKQLVTQHFCLKDYVQGFFACESLNAEVKCNAYVRQF